MHHLKKFSGYTPEKKTKLIVALVIKFVIFGTVFGGLMFFLKDYVSTMVLLAVAHFIVFTVALAVFFVHTHKAGQSLGK